MSLENQNLINFRFHLEFIAISFQVLKIIVSHKIL